MIYHSREKLQKNRVDPDVSTLSDAEVTEEFWDVANIGVRYLDIRALSDTDKLKLYAYYKQATEGDATDKGAPVDQKDAIKNLFWKNLKGMPQVEARRHYIETYLRLRRELHQQIELPQIRELLLDNIIATRHRKKWLEQGHERHSLISFKTPHFTTLYPDQLTPAMAAEYASKVGIRYKRTIFQPYLIDLRATRQPAPVSDAQFRHYLTDTSYSKLIFPLASIEPSKRAAYLDLFKLDGEGSAFYVIDTTSVHALPIQPDSGCYLGPAVVCLVKRPGEDGLLPTAIAVENIQSVDHFPPKMKFPETLKTLRVVHPDHGLAWEMAKLYVLQGVDYTQGLGMHVVLHVALMNPIALALEDTLRACGDQTASARILSEHTYLLLATNAFVLHSEYSVLWPDYKQQPYDAFCVSADLKAEDFEDLGGAFHIAKLLFFGWDGHPFFRGVNDIDLLHNTNYVDGIGAYRSFLRRMKEAVDAFVGDVLAVVGGDEEEQRFARVFCDRFIAHLPDKSMLKSHLHAAVDGDLFRELLSYAICNSIEHSVDHFHAGTMAATTQPRLRKPIDFADRRSDIGYIHARIGELNTYSDRSKYYLLNEITKKDIPVKTFGDLLFKEGGYFRGSTHRRKQELVGLEERFAARMVELCAASGPSHPPFCDIATSMQF